MTTLGHETMSYYCSGSLWQTFNTVLAQEQGCVYNNYRYVGFVHEYLT